MNRPNLLYAERSEGKGDGWMVMGYQGEKQIQIHEQHRQQVRLAQHHTVFSMVSEMTDEGGFKGALPNPFPNDTVGTHIAQKCSAPRIGSPANPCNQAFTVTPTPTPSPYKTEQEAVQDRPRPSELKKTAPPGLGIEQSVRNR
ncbi:hypothetical protein LX36DRAFT_675125 [Colletotrichum falcatum]|nr:hypothetical protein LX36DRAFT_675125 [Colletotrichum falcatum]